MAATRNYIKMMACLGFICTVTFASFLTLGYSALVTEITNTSASGRCSEAFWNESSRGKSYLFRDWYQEHGEGISYAEAKAECEALGAESERLVIESPQENSFVAQTMKRYRPGSDSALFVTCPANSSSGPYRKFNCKKIDAVYYEGSHSYLGYWAWRGGAPDSTSGGRCVLLDTSDQKWVVSACGPRSHFLVCQCRADPQPVHLRSKHFRRSSTDSKNCMNSTDVMRLVNVPNSLRCAKLCQADEQCASFNLLRANESTTQMVCELLSDESTTSPDNELYSKPGCQYFARNAPRA